MNTNKLLFDESPLVILPELAVHIGLNEAIILQQVHYWLQKNANIKDGKAWVYNSVREWQEQFPFWSADTIRRSLNKLMSDGIVVKGKYNKVSFDKTIWYTIDYDALDEKIKYSCAKSIYAKCINGYMQNAEMDICKMHKPIPETNTETNTEIKGRATLLGEFKNISLTEEERNKLYERFDKFITDKTIEKMSSYCEANGKKYKNYYAALLNWIKGSQKSQGVTREL